MRKVICPVRSGTTLRFAQGRATNSFFAYTATFNHDDIPLIFQLNLSYNGISGNIPSYAYELTYNNLSNNGFTSISDITDPEDKPLRELRVNGNQIGGSLPENLPYLPHLDILYLNDNEFEGNVPESYSLLLERDVALNLNGNRLSGDLPDKIRESDAFRKSAWTDILFQEGCRAAAGGEEKCEAHK